MAWDPVCSLIRTQESERVVRKQSWYGYKALIKRALSWRMPHFILRQVVRHSRSSLHYERLPAPATVTVVTARMGGVSFRMLHPNRCVVAKELYWGHGLRPGPADQYALDVFGLLAKRSALAVDIGAYTGIFALLAASVSRQIVVHAFDIVPEVAKAALDNVTANNLLTRVTVHLAGIGEHGTSVRVTRGHGGSALPDYYSTDMDFAQGVQVPLVSLDAVERHDLPGPHDGRTLVKIDVEGTEDQVLRSGGRFLASRRPDILCEVLYDRADVAAIVGALQPLRYRFLLVQDNQLKPYPTLHADRRYRDWLFTLMSDDELRRQGIAVATGS